MLVYLMIGAVLMWLTFDMKLFRDRVPMYMANFNIDRVARGNEPMNNQKAFETITLLIVFAIFLVFWPIVIGYGLVKLALK